MQINLPVAEENSEALVIRFGDDHVKFCNEKDKWNQIRILIIKNGANQSKR